MRYVALLRGINVGGNAIIKMADLRSCMEGLELENVTTYIASGNVLFEAHRSAPAELEPLIEQAIERRFRLPVMTIVLDRAEFRCIADSIPGEWIGDPDLRANVAFVHRDAEAAKVVRDLDPDPELEDVRAVPGAILWATRRSALNRSVMPEVIGGAAHKRLTVRSISTALKLAELLDREAD